MTASLEEAHRCLDLANADLEAFRVLAASPRIRPAIALFHAQQTAEKSLRVALFPQRLEFKRTHDLFELAERLRAAGATLPCAVELLGKLTPCAVLFRDDSLDIDLMPPGEAEQIAVGVLRWAQAIVAGAQV